MILVVVVVFTMMGLCAYLANVSANQHESHKDTVQFANLDATLNASAVAVENTIKERVRTMEFDNSLQGNPNLFDINIFMNMHGDKIRKLISTIAVVEYDRIFVEYKQRVPHYVHNSGTFYFDCIVASIQLEDGTIYNMSFYIAETEGNMGDGLYREKGDYLLTWISSS